MDRLAQVCGWYRLADCLAQDIPCFFLHRPSMLRGLYPKSLLQMIVKVPDSDAGHDALLLYSLSSDCIAINYSLLRKFGPFVVNFSTVCRTFRRNTSDTLNYAIGEEWQSPPSVVGRTALWHYRRSNTEQPFIKMNALLCSQKQGLQQPRPLLHLKSGRLRAKQRPPRQILADTPNTNLRRS